MPLKRQEEFCRDEFDRWLKDQLPGTSISWADGSEPPDFWLSLNGRKYAVEVTRILCEDDRAVTASLWGVVADTEDEARKAGKLSGTYVVEFAGPIKTFPKWRDELKARILDYAKWTASLQKHPGEDIAVKDQVLCHVSKLHPQGATIGCMGPDNRGGWENDIRRELLLLLQRAFDAKAQIPEKTNRPTVLILYDLYGLATRELFIECVKSINKVRLFHTVYVVQDKNRGYVAYEANPFQ